MTFARLLEIVGDAPVFETGLLLAGDVDPRDVRRQLCRWVRSGRLEQLRRGLYAVAPPYRKVTPHPFAVANRLVRPSYVSLQAALAFYGLIPEYAPLATSVTTRRPFEAGTSLGAFLFRHVQLDVFWGFRELELPGDQRALVATPEKALLDLVHLSVGGDTRGFLESLRLQNLDLLDEELLEQAAARWDKPRILRAAETLLELIREEREGFVTL